jgi:hypothetical protein
MNENICKNIIDQCCSNTPDYLVMYNGSPSTDYSVLLCKIHLCKKPFEQNILFVKELQNNEFNILEDDGHA